MTEPIRPALTPEEWREWLDVERDDRGYGVFRLRHQPGVVEQVAYRYADGMQIQANDEDTPPRVDIGDTDRHAFAALSLHGQPFGFTREDVAMLRSLASDAGLQAEPVILHLAVRIEALLPPEAK